MTEDALFAAVLEQTHTDRPRFLEQACGTDAGLLQRLRLRLAAHEHSRDSRWSRQRSVKYLVEPTSNWANIGWR